MRWGGGYWGKTGHANQRRWRQFVTRCVTSRPSIAALRKVHLPLMLDASLQLRLYWRGRARPDHPNTGHEQSVYLQWPDSGYFDYGTDFVSNFAIDTTRSMSAHLSFIMSGVGLRLERKRHENIQDVHARYDILFCSTSGRRPLAPGRRGREFPARQPGTIIRAGG
jgi:hypothetical protein